MADEKNIRINLQEIADFPNHPYEIRDDEDMFSLIERIYAKGVILPALVRQKEDGSYEMISRT